MYLSLKNFFDENNKLIKLLQKVQVVKLTNYFGDSYSCLW